MIKFEEEKRGWKCSKCKSIVAYELGQCSCGEYFSIYATIYRPHLKTLNQIKFEEFTKELTELSKKYKIEVYVTNTGSLYLGELDDEDVDGEYKITDGLDYSWNRTDSMKEIGWE